MHLEGGGVHRHQHAGPVAGGEDVPIGDLDLEGRDAGKGAGGRPYLGGEGGKGGQIVPEDGGRVREAIAGQLHAVARVACEADHHPVSIVNPNASAGGGEVGLSRTR